jgi:hypothetical protein
MLQILLEEEVKFIIVGAYALSAHGYPRATGDIDVWVKAEKENSKKIMKSLIRFGAPLQNVSEKDFQQKDIIFQIGIVPRRIDIITSIDGVEFDEADKDKVIVEIDGLKIPVLSREKLIKNKEATGREKDKLDVKMLKMKKK